MSDRRQEYERAVLTAIMHNPVVLDKAALPDEAFATQGHREIYAALRSIIDEGKKPDDQLLYDKLGRFEDLNSIASINWEHYAKELRRLAKIDGVRRSVLRAIDLLNEGNMDAAVEAMEAGIARSCDAEVGREYSMMDVVRAVVDEIEERYHAKGMPGLTTGFESLDRITSGLRRGSLIVIAARTSVGKTAFALSMIAKQAETGAKIGLISAEMSHKEIGLRMMSRFCGIPLYKLTSGMLTTNDFAVIADGGDKMVAGNVWVNDTPNISLNALRAQARAWGRRGAEVIYIDYMTLIRHGDPRTPRPERVGEISKQLKELARQLDIPIVVLSQLNRMAEDEEPSLAHIRQSGEIEEDADLIILLKRERDETIAKVNVAKNRHGNSSFVELDFDPATVSFSEIKAVHHERE